MVFNFKKQQPLAPEDLIKNIRMIGDRGAGKTTYLTALACLSGDDPDNPVDRIIPGKDTENMIRISKECLRQKVEIPPDDYREGLKKSYVFTIELKDSSSLEIECKDYPGEFFKDLVDNTNPELLREYIGDCTIDGAGILILLDGTAQQDEYYAECIYQLLFQLNAATSKNSRSRRVAVALSKCDLPQLWIHRNNPTKKIQARFEGVYSKLKTFHKIHVEFFATSAYGVLGNDIQIANSHTTKADKNGTRAIILESDFKLWRPFGLIEPIYWLYTGKKY